MIPDYKNLKKTLEELTQKRREEKAREEQERQERNDKDRTKILENISSDLSESLKPVLASLAENSKLSTDDIRQALAEAIQISLPEVKVPEIKIPEIKVPEVRVAPPVVNVPAPVVKVTTPEMNFPKEMGLKPGPKPFPVIMMDQAGKPMMFPASMGAGGGKADFFTIKGFSESAFADFQNADGRLRVSVETGGSAITDAELRAAHLDVQQLSGAVDSVNVVTVSDIFSTTSASTVVNPDNRVKVELPATTVTVSDITASLKAALVDSTGVQYSGSNPVPTYLVASSGNSTISVGDLASDAADTGSAPVKVGGIARQANPTAVAAGDRVSATFDDLGRQVIRSVQVRDLIKTAYVSVTNGTETTLISGVAGAFLDLIYIMGSNASDAAVTVDIRAVTAGNVLMGLRIPANGTAGVALPVPLPQDATGNNWTVDGPDETGRTITISALFSQEV